MIRLSGFHKTWVFAVLLLASLSVSGTDPGQQPEDTDAAIQFLLNHVAESGLIFMRNSQRHDAATAAEHMNNKYRYYRDKIKTAEDFIERCASKSLLSGKPYLVIMENGEEVRTDGWLLRALTDYRHRQAENPG